MAMHAKLVVTLGLDLTDNVAHTFVISVLHDESNELRRWKVVRTLDQFVMLRTQMLSDNVFPDSNPFLQNEVATECGLLEERFNSLIGSVGDTLWNYPPLINFLDNCSEQSAIMQLRINFLSKEVQRLSGDLRSQADKVQEMQTSHYFLFGIVQDMLAGYDTGLKKKMAAAGQHSDLLKSMYHVPSGSSSGHTDDERSADSGANSNQSSFLSVNTSDLRSASASSSAGYAMFSDSNTTADRTHSGSSDAADHSAASSPRTTSVKGSLAPTPVLSMKRFDFIEKTEVPPPIMVNEEENGSRSASNSVPSTPHFPVELHPSAEMCAYYGASVEHILKVVRPTSAQMQYRYSVITMLKKQVRLGLNCNAFPTGLHDVLCSLPDDPIALSVIISKNLVSTWHMCLVDRLNLMSERQATSGNVDMVFAEEEELLVNLPEDYNAPLRHEITNMTHSKLNMSFAVHLQVDNSCEVEILANNRHDLCMLAFLEEMTALVGKDSLFKRSLLLIRAWWQYETAAYVGTPIKHYLKDSNICVMVCAIFNQYHARICSPLQALCLFLAEYSAYDGATHAITLQGIVPFKSLTSSQPILSDAHNGQLISCEVIEKYWNLFNLSSANLEDSEYENIIRSSSSDDVHFDDGSGIAGASIVVRRCAEEFPDERSAPGGIEKIAMKNLSSHNLHYFERQVFNIVHPFNHTNMVAEKLSSRRQMRLHKAFQIGASEMTVYLRQSIANANNSGDLLNYFPNLLAKFGEGKGVASLKDTIAPMPVIDEKFYSVADKLSSNIMYCNMMLESVLSEQALLTLSTEILAVKGPLPVGEIGKLLAETTSIGSLSQKLKERFGGLKKFLERFQGSFVISNDHPFNPNVLLRGSLSAEHLDLIDRGIFPHQLLLKAKKPVAPTKKKKAATGGGAVGDFSSTSGSGTGGSPLSNNSVPNSPFLAQQAHKFMTSPNLSIHAMSSPNLLQQSGSAGAGAMNNQPKFQGKNPNVVTSPVSSIHKGAKFGSFTTYPSGGNQQAQQQHPQQGHHQQAPYNAPPQSYQPYAQMGHMMQHQQKQQQPPPQQSPHMLYAQTPSQSQAQAQAQAQAMLGGHMSQQFGGPQGMGYPQNHGPAMNNSNNMNNTMANTMGNNMNGGPGGSNNQFSPTFSVRDNELTSRGSFNLGSGRSGGQTSSSNVGGDTKFFPSSNSPEAKYFQPQQMQQPQSSFFDDILSGTTGGALDPSASIANHRGLLQSSTSNNHQSQLLSNLRLSSLDLPAPGSADDMSAHAQRMSQSQPGALYALQADAHLQVNASGYPQQYHTSPPSQSHQHGMGQAAHHSQQGLTAQHLSSPPQAPSPQLTSAQHLFGHPQAPYAPFDGSAAADSNLAQRGDSFLRDYSKH